MNAYSQITYGGVLIAVFANQICLPIPSIVFLMAAGALSAHGQMRASIIVILSVVACLIADWIWFWLGRRWGSRAMAVLCRFAADPRKSTRDAHEKFRRYGLPVLCVAKFIPGVDGVLPPLVGAEGVSLASFLALDAIGSLLWSVAYVGLGYVFANQLDSAVAWSEHFGTALAALIGIPIVLYAGWRGFTLLRMIRRLRVHRISPRMLHRKLKSKTKVAVLDLLEFEVETDGDNSGAIPGAFRVDPSRLRNSPHISVPADVQIVLYTSSGRDTLCARAAVGLNRIGVQNVWVLEGGLNAWREKGFPLALSPESPEVVAGRLGVKLPPPGDSATG
jgi:membrane protein DedA with SNARE-associated domain/rhodanese-related sulfurtransferase